MEDSGYFDNNRYSSMSNWKKFFCSNKRSDHTSLIIEIPRDCTEAYSVQGGNASYRKLSFIVVTLEGFSTWLVTDQTDVSITWTDRHTQSQRNDRGVNKRFEHVFASYGTCRSRVASKFHRGICIALLLMQSRMSGIV